jgi:predicted kinase
LIAARGQIGRLAAAPEQRVTRRRDTIATLHLICGLPCSGKTTLAKTIELERLALRLSPDEWIVTLYGADISDEALDAARDPVETALWDLAARVLVLGLDVILEYGFWSRSEREEFRRRATRLGARSELHFTDAPREELIRRLAQRNAQLPAGSFWIDEARLRSWCDVFEPPSTDELRPRETANGDVEAP